MKILIIATFYALCFEGRTTSSGTLFKHSEMTCASLDYKIGSMLRVTNKSNLKSVIVKVSDKCRRRGIVDLSRSSFLKIGKLSQGKLNVKIEKI